MTTVDLVRVGPRAPRREARVVRHLSLAPSDSGSSDWVIAGRSSRSVDAAGQHVLELRGSGPGSLTIRGLFDPRTFQRVVVVHGRHSGPELVSLELCRAGEVVLDVIKTPLLPGEQRLPIDMDGLRGEEQPFDELVLRWEGKTPALDLAGIELVEVPPECALPDADGETWIALESDQRRGFVLRGGEVWKGRFELAGPAQLTTCVALPHLARVPGAGGRLELRLSHGEEERRASLRVDRLARAGARWQGMGVPLGPNASAGVRGELWTQGEVELEVRLVGGPDVVCALELPAVSRPLEEAPVVLCVTSDTHRADYLGRAPGSAQVRTPALDRLAEEGVLFENAFAASNLTVPSHSALLTAAHPRETRVIGNSDTLAEEAVTLAERFAEAGFTCLAAVSAAHLDPVSSGLGQGFQRYQCPLETQRDSRRTIAGLERWLSELHGRPLFVWLHVFDAHAPYVPPRGYREQYYDAERDPFDPELAEPADHRVPAWAAGVRDLAYVAAAYGGEVTYLDEQLARLLEHATLARATVAFTADHGEALGEQDFWFTHDPLSPATLHVPLVLRASSLPERLRGKHVGQAVATLDLGRTLLDLAGLTASDFPGRNLLGDLLPPSGAEVHEEPRYAIAMQGHSASVEWQDWFLTLHLFGREMRTGRVIERHQVELFDLAGDPRCERDLAPVELERARRLRELLVRFLTETRELGWRSSAPPSVRQRAHVRALGYAEGLLEHVADDWFDASCRCEWCLTYGR